MDLFIQEIRNDDVTFQNDKEAENYTIYLTEIVFLLNKYFRRIVNNSTLIEVHRFRILVSVAVSYYKIQNLTREGNTIPFMSFPFKSPAK